MIVFYRLEGRDYKEIGRVANGKIIEGEDSLEGVIYTPNIQDEELLLEVHNGPHLFAEMAEESNQSDSDSDDDNRDTEKWIPYQDTDDGRGWVNTETGEKQFTDEAPGPIAKGFENQAEDWVSGSTAKLEKEWIPYQGPHGGEGWQEVETGNVRYIEEPPGRVRGQTGNGENTAENGMTPEERQWLADHTSDDEALSAVREDAPDGDTETAEEITWDTVSQGDEVAYYDRYDELQTGPVTAVEQDAFGVVWVEDDSGIKQSVEEEDFIGEPEEIISDSIEAPDNIDAEWMDNNIFWGQQVKLRDKNSDTVEYGDIRNVFVAGGQINAVEVELDRGRGIPKTVTITNDEIDWYNDDDNENYEIQETTSWDSLNEEEQTDALKDSFSKNTELRTMSRQTREKVREQVTEEVIPSFRDMDIARETMKSLFKIENKVSRASCSGIGSTRIKVSQSANPDTTQHEFGHAIVGSFGYNYANRMDSDKYSDEKYKRRPTNLSHDYSEIKTFYDTVPFVFSDDSDYFAPRDYMLRGRDQNKIEEPDDWHEYDDETDTFEIQGERVQFRLSGGERWEATVENVKPEGKLHLILSDEGPERHVWLDPSGSIQTANNDWGDAIGIEDPVNPPGFGEWKEAVDEEVNSEPQLAQREYESVDDMTPKDVFESVDTGDVVRFEFDGNEMHLIAREKENLPQEDRRDYEFVDADGVQFNFTVDSSTEQLQFSDHTVTGFDPTKSDEEEASPHVGNALENWDGINANAKTGEERMKNMVSAVNRAWYKQAKTLEANPNSFDNTVVTIGSGYSATNAHETMAKTHEVIQNGDDVAMTQLMDSHPSLVAAYIEIFNVPEQSEKAIERHENSDKYGIEI